jgi:hypothetical protein
MEIFGTGVRVWLLVSLVIVVIDCVYLLQRPHTMAGGAFGHLFPQYAIYIKYDRLYADLEDRFVVIMSWMNLPELALQLLAVVLSYRRGQRAASVVLIICSTMTFWKTVLYMWYDMAFLTPLSDTLNVYMFLLYLLPNSFWLFMPLYCMIYPGYRLALDS